MRAALLLALPACTNTLVIGELAPDAGADARPGPTVEVRLRATAAAFAQTDGLSGETPRKASLGIRSLRLMSGPTDPNPALVFDLGTAFVEAPLDDGSDTSIATVAIARVRAGSYAWAKVGVSHVRYQVDATMHSAGIDLAGVFDNAQVLSSGTLLDGVARDAGWYRFSFVANGTTWGTITGANGPLPTYPQSGGIGLVVEANSAYYTFPVTTVIDPGVTRDWVVTLVLNVDHDFRWEDTPGAGHQPGVFDAEPTAFEPVRRFGANAMTLEVRQK